MTLIKVLSKLEDILIENGFVQVIKDPLFYTYVGYPEQYLCKFKYEKDGRYCNLMIVENSGIDIEIDDEVIEYLTGDVFDFEEFKKIIK